MLCLGMHTTGLLVFRCNPLKGYISRNRIFTHSLNHSLTHSLTRSKKSSKRRIVENQAVDGKYIVDIVYSV